MASLAQNARENPGHEPLKLLVINKIKSLKKIGKIFMGHIINEGRPSLRSRRLFPKTYAKGTKLGGGVKNNEKETADTQAKVVQWCDV